MAAFVDIRQPMGAENGRTLVVVAGNFLGGTEVHGAGQYVA